MSSPTHNEDAAAYEELPIGLWRTFEPETYPNFERTRRFRTGR